MDITGILQKQLELLSNVSEEEYSDRDLASLTYAMIAVARELQSKDKKDYYIKDCQGVDRDKLDKTLKDLAEALKRKRRIGSNLQEGIKQ